MISLSAICLEILVLAGVVIIVFLVCDAEFKVNYALPRNERRESSRRSNPVGLAGVSAHMVKGKL